MDRTIKAVLLLGLALASSLNGEPVTAQSGDDLTRQTADFTALIDAENRKSALCRSYIGRTVIPTAFDALARRLSGLSGRGEYETTAQYEARRRSTEAQANAGPTVVQVPIDLSFVQYDADARAMVVRAGAVWSEPVVYGGFSPELGADLAAEVALGRDGSSAPPKGAPVFISDTVRITRTGIAQKCFWSAGPNIRCGKENAGTLSLHPKAVPLCCSLEFANYGFPGSASFGRKIEAVATNGARYRTPSTTGSSWFIGRSSGNIARTDPLYRVVHHHHRECPMWPVAERIRPSAFLR